MLCHCSTWQHWHWVLQQVSFLSHILHSNPTLSFGGCCVFSGMRNHASLCIGTTSLIWVLVFVSMCLCLCTDATCVCVRAGARARARVESCASPVVSQIEWSRSELLSCCRCHQSWSDDLQAASHPVWQKLKTAQAEYQHAMADLESQEAPRMLSLTAVSSLLRRVAEVCS